MITTFSHPKGGVGKSTLCLNYLSYLQEQKKEFVIIDLDGQNSITNANKLRAMHNVATFDIKTFSNTDSLIEYLDKNSGKNLIIDSGGFDSAYNRIAVSMSDVIITPLSDSPFEVMRLVSFDDILSEIEQELQKTNPQFKLKVHLVLNRINSAVTRLDSILDPFNDSKHYIVMESVIRDRALIKYSPSTGESVFEKKSKTNSDISAKKEILAFCQEIEALQFKGE